MLLVLDIGNSHIVVAIHDETQWIHSWRIHSDQQKTSDEYYVLAKSMLQEVQVNPKHITRAIVSSVVPNLTRAFQKVVTQLINNEPIMASHDRAPYIQKETIPAQLGYDMLANAVGARSKFPHSNVGVFDFGTALTWTVVSHEGALLGAAIAPGLLTAVNALFSQTAQLPQVQLKIPTTALGRDTNQAVHSGIMYGYSGLVKELIKRTEAEIGQELKVIATGGLSATISPLIGRFDLIEPLHTLDGLRLMALEDKLPVLEDLHL